MGGRHKEATSVLQHSTVHARAERGKKEDGEKRPAKVRWFKGDTHSAEIENEMWEWGQDQTKPRFRKKKKEMK